MSTAVRISDVLISDAKKFSRIDHRSIPSQIEHWAIIGKYSEENPDLPYSLIKDMLIGMEELNTDQRSEYIFG